MRLCRRRIFFLRVASRKKGRKIKYRRATYYKIRPWVFFVLWVAQVKKAKDFFANELHTRAVEVREAKEAIESARAGLSPQKGNVRKKRKEKRKTKEGGLSPQEGDVRKRRKGKKKTMEGEKVATAKARFRVPYTKIFFFWFRSIWAWKRPVLVEVSAPTRLGLRGSHVRRKFRKRTTLRSESSTLKGLLYAPIKQEQYHKRTTLRRLKSRCKAFVARKVRTIALEQSVSEKAVLWQATINLYSRVGDPLVIPCLGCTA
jgi:hypothetical protein